MSDTPAPTPATPTPPDRPAGSPGPTPAAGPDDHAPDASSGVPAGGRFQLALRVPDVAAAAEFYTAALGVPPAKRRPGYVNFAVARPPLKLVLIEDGSAEAGHDVGVRGRTALDHLGIEVPEVAAVGDATRRLAETGVAIDVRDATTCCYAVQDKVVAHGPGREMFEVYTVVADDRPELEGATTAPTGAVGPQSRTAGCCGSACC